MIKVNEIFVSADGEVNAFGQGRLSTFIRLAGCNLDCFHCDTKYAQTDEGAKEMSIEQILATVARIGCPNITLTGGEPLLQSESIELIESLACDGGYHLIVETNGSMPIPTTHLNLVGSWIVDYKLNHPDVMELSAFRNLRNQDWVKFVIRNRTDYIEARQVKTLLKEAGCQGRVAFSPVKGFKPGILLNWLIDDKEWNVTINIQLHKLVGFK